MTKDKSYPTTLYTGTKGHEVKKRLMPDGEVTALPVEPSLLVAEHSPDGFSWGYNGSGPAQLSLAILLDITSDPETARKFAYDFLSDFVSGWQDGWGITSDIVLAWLDKVKAEYVALKAGRN